jgi:hypothetical protein
MITLSKAAVAGVAVSWLVTASPMNAEVGIVIVSLPINVHVVPLADSYALKRFPFLVSFTQRGAVAVVPAV